MSSAITPPMGGDLGFAIERCVRTAVVGNTALANNSPGLSIVKSSYVAVTGNVCMNNQQDRAVEFYNLRACGGIRIEEDSHFVAVTGNTCSDDQAVSTQGYGIVLLETGAPISNIQVADNMCAGNVWGNVFSEPTATSNIIISHSQWRRECYRVLP